MKKKKRRHRKKKPFSLISAIKPKKPLTQHQKDFREAVSRCKGLPSKPSPDGQFQMCVSSELKRIKSQRGE